MRCHLSLLGLLALGVLAPMLALSQEKPKLPDRGPVWARHTIDASSNGADGVRLADVNGDGLLDIATGWEQGGIVRAYLHPGHAKAKKPWPAVTVGKVGAPEDAVFVDLDGDGAVDVISCCEGNIKTVFVHWAPKDPAKYLDAAAWKTEAFPALEGKQQWMFCLPLQVDGQHGVDLVVGAKNQGAEIGWLEAPAKPRDLAGWKWHPLRSAGWIMSLVASDIDGDGDQDLVFSDRRGKHRGVFWLENPGPGAEQAKAWKEHAIGAQNKEVMFLDLADLDGDGLLDVVVPTHNRELLFLRRKKDKTIAWETHSIPFPEHTGGGKGIRVADLDGDGKRDLVMTCEGAKDVSGVVWLSYRKSPTDRAWDVHEISGLGGVKFDIIQLMDVDGDGDLDLLTTEEVSKLGVIWYENPTKK